MRSAELLDPGDCSESKKSRWLRLLQRETWERRRVSRIQEATASEPTTNSDAAHSGENAELNAPDTGLQTPGSETDSGSGLANETGTYVVGLSLGPEETQTAASVLGAGVKPGAGRGVVEDVPDWQELYLRGAVGDVRDLKLAFELSQQRIERVVQEGLGQVRHLDESRQREALALRDELRSNRTEATREAQDARREVRGNRLVTAGIFVAIAGIFVAIVIGVVGILR